MDVDAFYATLGRNITAARKSCHATQQDIADVAKLTRSSIANIENGRQHPSLHTVLIIAEALQVSLADLLSGDEERLATADLKYGYRHGYRRGWKNCLTWMRNTVNAKLEVPSVGEININELEADDAEA